MKSKLISLIILSVLFPCSFAANLVQVRGNSLPILSIEPSYKIVSVGQVFHLNLSIKNLDASNRMVAYSYLLWLPDCVFCGAAFDTDVLDLVDVDEGPFLKQFAEHGTWFNTYEYIAGMLLPNSCCPVWTRFPEGSGTLAMMTFRAKIAGNSTFTPIYRTVILNDESEEVAHEVFDGFIEAREPIPGDLNLDSYVGIGDLIIAGECFGSRPSSSRWNSNADINEDEYIGVDDIVLIARNFGTAY